MPMPHIVRVTHSCGHQEQVDVQPSAARVGSRNAIAQVKSYAARNHCAQCRCDEDCAWRHKTRYDPRRIHAVPEAAVAA